MIALDPLFFILCKILTSKLWKRGAFAYLVSNYFYFYLRWIKMDNERFQKFCCLCVCVCVCVSLSGDSQHSISLVPHVLIQCCTMLVVSIQPVSFYLPIIILTDGSSNISFQYMLCTHPLCQQLQDLEGFVGARSYPERDIFLTEKHMFNQYLVPRR